MNKNIKVVVVIGIAFMLFACKSRQYAVVQKISLNNDSVKINLPRNAEKLTKDEFVKLEEQSFKDTISFKYSDDIYNANGIVIGLWGRVVPSKESKNGLWIIESATKAMFSSTPAAKYSDKMITLGDNQILIMSYERKYKRDLFTRGYYSFYVVNSDISFNTKGIIQFNIDQKETATTILNDMVKSIEFSNK